MAMKLDLRRDLAVAITEAQYKYMEMTGKREFRAVEKSIPEKILEVSAANKCWSNLKGRDYHVIQEYTFSSINRNLRDAFGDSRAKKYENSTKRVDIAILDEYQKLIALIEVKRKGSLSDAGPSGDITRLRTLCSYIYKRTSFSVKAYFAYAITMHYRDDEMFYANESIYKEEALEKFGKNYFMYFDRNNTHKIADDDLNFCFGAVCGII